MESTAGRLRPRFVEEARDVKSGAEPHARTRRRAPTRSTPDVDASSVASTNLKVGLTNRTGQDGQATADFGLTYMLTQDIQLDGGIAVGLTRAAEDANPFLGLSFRLRAIAKEKTT